MILIKVVISFLLFLSALVYWPENFLWTARFLYIGIILPLVYQKMWFHSFDCFKKRTNKWKKILWSFVFILSSVFVIDIFMLMKVIIDEANGIMPYSVLCVLFYISNKWLFFFAILYLWNDEVFSRNNKILYYLFNVARIFYAIIALPAFIVLLSVLVKYIIVSAQLFIL